MNNNSPTSNCQKQRPLAALLGALATMGFVSYAVYRSVVRPWHKRWGATQDEINRTLPGDDLVPDPRFSATHAVTINAPVSKVWPWIVQIGQGRGGFYSYDWIENMMGLDIHSTDRILSEYQDLTVGDIIPLAPDESVGVPVVELEKERVIVLHGDTRTGDGEATPIVKPGDYLHVSWVFFLESLDDRTTRFIERFKLDYNPSLTNRIFYHFVLEPGSFIMERKMLLGIKERAERLAAEKAS